MLKPISVQLYTVRELCKQDFFGVLKELAAIGYVGVEFAGFHGKTAAEVAAKLKELGLKASGAHAGVPTADNINQMKADAQTLSYNIVVGGPGRDDCKSEEACKAVAEKYAKGAELAKSAGLSFAMHNHWWEFDHEFNGKTPFEIIMNAAPAIGSELDIYWCAKAGRDPVAEMKKWDRRVPLVHVKDGDLGEESIHKALGTGKVPVKQTLAESKTAQWLVVELDNCATDMMEAVRQSYKFMTSNGLAKGNK